VPKLSIVPHLDVFEHCGAPLLPRCIRVVGQFALSEARRLSDTTFDAPMLVMGVTCAADGAANSCCGSLNTSRAV